MGEAAEAQLRYYGAKEANGHSPRAVMLVSNSCVNDTRVIRAAETVAAEGYETIVLAVADNGKTSEERRNGVLYRRLERIATRSAPTPVNASLLRQFLRQCRGIARIVHARLMRLFIRAFIRLTQIAHTRPFIRPFIHPIIRPFRRIIRMSVRTYRLGRARAIRTARFMRRQKGLARSFVRTVPSRICRPLVEARRIKTLFEEELRRLEPDIIHAHDLVTLPVGSIVAHSVRARLIYDSHELEVHRNVRNAFLDKWLRYGIERKHIRSCDAVVTVCDSIADHLAGAYKIRRPIVVMNAPDCEARRPCKRDLRSVLGLESETPLAVYVGRITIGRGIEQIVTCLQHLPRFHLALIGAVNLPTLNAARGVAKLLGVAERLHVLNPVAPDEVVSFISTADVSIVPVQNVCLSYYYSLPNKLLESAMARLPVVVSNFPELKRFVEISGGGVVMDEKEPHDIARALQEAYDHRVRLRLDAHRWHRVEDIYGWPRQKDALKALYASFALHSSAPAQRKTISSTDKGAVAHASHLGAILVSEGDA
jgi:glycosyltransferase involved in cell wall biosynthesis